jgi:hypothetical protein
MSGEDRSQPSAGTAAPASEEEAWAEVLAAWSDEAAHRRYLGRFPSIEALAVAGGRYKAVLDERPDDAMAVLMRGEIVKKATAYGLAALPRTPAEPPRNVRRMRIALALAAGAIVAWCLFQIAALLVRARS